MFNKEEMEIAKSIVKLCIGLTAVALLYLLLNFAIILDNIL